MNFLAARRVGKDFFEEAQKNKRVQIDRLKIRRISAPDITTQISSDMREWHEEYCRSRTGKIASILDTQEDETEGENESSDHETPEETAPTTTEQEIFRPWYENPSGIEDDSFENIKREFEPSARRLLEASALTDPEEFRKLVTEEIRHLCRLLYRVSALKPPCLRTESHQGEGLQ
jgi:hypothetical protein